MLITRYFKESDDLYVYISGVFEPGESKWQIPFDFEHPELGGIVADVTATGKILWFEIGDAMRRVQWVENEPGTGPRVSESFERDSDELCITFGTHCARTIPVRDQMFTGFAVNVDVDRYGAIAALRIPSASTQLAV